MRRPMLAAALLAALALLLRKLLEDLDSRASSAPSPATRESQGVTDLGAISRKQLYELAKELQIPGRSKMTKDELARAVERKGKGRQSQS